FEADEHSIGFWGFVRYPVPLTVAFDEEPDWYPGGRLIRCRLLRKRQSRPSKTSSTESGQGLGPAPRSKTKTPRSAEATSGCSSLRLPTTCSRPSLPLTKRIVCGSAPQWQSGRGTLP